MAVRQPKCFVVEGGTGSTLKTERNYWLGWSALIGVMASVAAMTDPPWSVAMLAGLVLVVLSQGIHYKQIGRHMQGKLATANPRVAVFGAVLVARPC